MSDAKKPKKPVKKTAKAKKKTEMKDMSQTHGKVEEPQEVVATTLDQIHLWGQGARGLGCPKTKNCYCDKGVVGLLFNVPRG